VNYVVAGVASAVRTGFTVSLVAGAADARACLLVSVAEPVSPVQLWSMPAATCLRCMSVPSVVIPMEKSVFK